MVDVIAEQETNRHKEECIRAIRNVLTPEEFRGFVKGTAMFAAWMEEPGSIFRTLIRENLI